MKTFTLFWLTGESEVIRGNDFLHALVLAGYNNDEVYAIDFYTYGDKRLKYEWNVEKHKWCKTDLSKNKNIVVVNY